MFKIKPSDNDTETTNSAVSAMRELQQQMAGEAEKAGFQSEADVSDWVTESRRNENLK